MPILPERKVHFISERSQGAVVVELLVTGVRQLDQRLDLGHWNRNSVFTITIVVRIGDGLFIASWNSVNLKLKLLHYHFITRVMAMFHFCQLLCVMHYFCASYKTKGFENNIFQKLNFT